MSSSCWAFSANPLYLQLSYFLCTFVVCCCSLVAALQSAFCICSYSLSNNTLVGHDSLTCPDVSSLAAGIHAGNAYTYKMSLTYTSEIFESARPSKKSGHLLFVAQCNLHYQMQVTGPSAPFGAEGLCNISCTMSLHPLSPTILAQLLINCPLTFHHSLPIDKYMSLSYAHHNGLLKWRADILPCLPALAIKRRWRTMSTSHRLFSCAAIPLRFATRNCRSLASKIKLEQLGLDVKSYSIDFLALQETRMVAGSHPIKVPHTHAMLYSLNGGIGFVVGKRLLPYLQTSRVISDRVAVVSFCFGKPDPPISVVIAWERQRAQVTTDPLRACTPSTSLPRRCWLTVLQPTLKPMVYSQKSNVLWGRGPEAAWTVWQLTKW